MTNFPELGNFRKKKEKIENPSYVLRHFIKYKISDLMNSVFLLSFFCFKISELYNLEILFSLNANFRVKSIILCFLPNFTQDFF